MNRSSGQSVAAKTMGETMASVKDAVFKLQTTLLDGVTKEAQLQAAGNLLTKLDYADVVTERTIVNLCGYPICNNKLPERQRKGRYRISLKEHKVYDLQETWLYCSAECLIKSRTFSDALEPDRDAIVDQDKIFRILDAVGSLSLDDEGNENDALENKNVVEGSKNVPDACKIVLEGANNVLEGSKNFAEEIKRSRKVKAEGKIAEQEKLSSLLVIREQENGDGEKIAVFDYAGPSDAIEGYVPQREHGRPSTSDAEHIAAKGSSPKSQARPPSKRGSKKSKSSPKQGAHKIENDFISTIIIGEPCARAVSNSATSSCCLIEELPDQGDQNSKGNQDLQSGTKPDVPKLRSSLKSQGGKQLNRSVTWADEKTIEQGNSLEVQKDGNVDNLEKTLTVISPGLESTIQNKMSSKDAESLESIRSEYSDESVNSARIESAEAFAMALTEAAAAVELGEMDASEAVSKAGMYILPGTLDKEQEESRHDADMLESNRMNQIWPSIPSSAGEESYDARDCWYDAPPEGFSLELSPFATMWKAVDGWITASSVAHLYGRDESDEDDFLTVNGREYPRKIVIGSGLSAEIERTLASCISRALLGVVESLRLPLSISTLEQALGRLLNSMSFVDAIPPFRMKQWHVIVLLFLDALSVHRIPSLGPQMINKRPLIHKVLDAAGMTYEEYQTMKELMIPLGRLPQFSAQSGG